MKQLRILTWFPIIGGVIGLSWALRSKRRVKFVSDLWIVYHMLCILFVLGFICGFFIARGLG